METPHPASQVHPFTIRLFVDVDPAGNPVGFGAVQYVRGKEMATILFGTPGPFDTLSEAMTYLADQHAALIGTMRTLFP